MKGAKCQFLGFPLLALNTVAVLLDCDPDLLNLANVL